MSVRVTLSIFTPHRNQKIDTGQGGCARARRHQLDLIQRLALQLQSVADGGGADEPEPGDMPLHTEHHAEGHHTTTHESGKAHDSENLDALKSHLDKYFSEEQQEPSEEGGPEYE